MTGRLMIAVAVATALSVAAAEMELRPVADTTLHQIAPTSNMGAHSHVAVGTTAKSTAARGLFRFDLSSIPANSLASAVTLTFTLPALNRPDAAGSVYEAHRILTPWGEGSKVGNLGAAGSAGEATWQHSAIPETWDAPGGLPGVDFASIPSASQTLGPAPGVYAIDSTSALVADVQHWIANPEENLGWLLKVEDESVSQTARQFASRETANGAILRVTYSAPPAAELRITSIERVNTNVVIRWTGGQENVDVERAAEVRGTWERIGESAEGLFTTELSDSRAYFRLSN